MKKKKGYTMRLQELRTNFMKKETGLTGVT
jgi:hypothetical protein